MVDFILKICPEWEKYATVDKKENKVLYIKLKCELYSCINGALLFWKKLLTDLESMEFKVNLYDPCVANIMINGKQLTIVWNIDNLKMSH